MPVREVGVIALGKSLVRQTYPQNNYNGSSKPVSWNGLVTAIENFSKTAFADHVESFQMKDRVFLLLNGRILADREQAPLRVYALCEKSFPEKAVREALTRIHAAFLLEYPKIKSSTPLEEYQEFTQIIDDILGDLILRPQDRLDRLL